MTKVTTRLKVFGCASLVGLVCMAASGGCGTNLHKAEQASAGLAAALNTAATVNHSDAFESAAEKQMVATDIVQVAAANDNLIGALKVAEAQGATASPVAIEAAVQSLINTVNNLNAGGVLKLKSTQAQADFQIAMASVQASLAAIEALYPGVNQLLSPVSDGKHSPLRPSRFMPLLGVALTPEEIEELIALLVTAGSALLPKLEALRTETDPQLLAAAAADDASAEAIAESDGAPAPAAVNAAAQEQEPTQT